MKRTILLLTCLFTTLFINAQDDDAGVEYLTYGVQTGFLGAWFNVEAGLAPTFAFRGEAGLDGGFFGGSLSENGYVFTSVLSVEPRWYYNIVSRYKKGRKTDKNSADFLTVKVSYHTDLVTITNVDNVSVARDVSFIPTWGIRRHIGDHFNYEAGIGLGYQLTIHKQNYDGYKPKNEWDTVGNLHIRIGYTF